MMSPLFIVGITLLTTVLGDVSHVLQDQAHPPADPQDINNAFSSKDFWWMRDDSPLKASYDYFKKCAATGKCASDKTRTQFNIDDEGTAPIDVKKNVFLNGNFVASSVSKNALSAGNSSETKSFHSGAKLDFSNNPFLQGGFAHAGSATSSSSQACNGSDRTCVPIEDCSNGVVLASATIKNTSQRCTKNQVCCRLHSGGKSSVADHINQLLFIPGKSKVTGKDGLTSEQVQIIHTSQEGIRPQINLIGEFVGSSTVKPVRDLSAAANSPVFSSTPDYSNFNFGDSARDSDFDGPDYLPPVKPTTCPPGQFVGSFGRCEPKRPECLSGSLPTPSGGCEVLKCPPGEQLGPYGRCIPIPIPPPPVCPPGQKPSLYGGCVSTPTPPPPPPVCPPGQKPGPYGGCVSTPTPSPPSPVTCSPGQKPGPYGSCVPISTPPPPPPPLDCPPGQKPGPYGGCVSTPTPPPPPPVCPPGQKPGPYGGCVSTPTPPPPPPVCPPGQKPGPYGSCVSVSTPPPYCPSGHREGPNGACIPITTITPAPPRPYCATGEKLVNGKCVSICGPEEKPTLLGTCLPIRPTPSPPSPPRKCLSGQKFVNGECVTLCGSGQRPTQFGGCEDIIVTPPPLYCPSGYREGHNGECIPIIITTPTPPAPYCARGKKLVNGQCVAICGPGQKPTLIGTCEPVVHTTPPPPPPPPSCPTNKKLVNGVCIPIACPSGQKLDLDRCVPIPPPQPPISCLPGQKYGPYGCVPVSPPAPPAPYCASGEKLVNGKCVAICGPGQKPTPIGTCEPVIHTTPPPPSCPTNKKLVNGVCIPIACPPGQKLDLDRCVPIPPPQPPISCLPGQKYGPYGCVPISPPAPPAPYCASGEKLVNGKCVVICGPGEKPTLIGTCVPIRPPPSPPPQCLSGTKLVNGKCISVTPLPPTPPPCQPGEQRNSFGECVKPQPPTKTCRPGYELNRYGNCEKIQKPGPYCPSGQREVNGGCVEVEKCRPGEESGPFGCRRKPCPPGSVLSVSGNCEFPPRPTPTCPPGTIKTPSGRCEPTPPPPPPPCPSGSYLGPHGCVKLPTNYLPPETTTPRFRDGEEIDDEYNPEADSTRISILKTTPPPRRTENDTIIPDELVPVGCAAALKCVQEIYCTADGFVSPVPVVLTKEQELLKAPTTVCRDIESGTLGKCCRDRDYQDPWPSANLVNGVDDGQYAEDDSIGQYKAQYNRISRSSARRTKRATGECGTRHLNSSPRGQVPIDANFAEISWQAMILRDSNRSLLCGGAIIRRNAVLTAAHCVEGLQTSDVLIKGGEWKLGIDEEPLPFQIVKVAAILRHPDFKAGSLQNDLAVLVLEENLRFAKNIEQICLPEPNLIPTQNCIATGWGKRILQLHAKNALMHRIDVNVMDVEQCQEVMGQYFQKLLPNYNTNALCGFSDVDQCKVDYGSALACADESGRYTLSGIYSWDTGCKQQGQIGGYVAPDVEWVETILSTPLKQLKRLDRLYNSAKVQ